MKNDIILIGEMIFRALPVNEYLDAVRKKEVNCSPAGSESKKT